MTKLPGQTTCARAPNAITIATSISFICALATGRRRALAPGAHAIDVAIKIQTWTRTPRAPSRSLCSRAHGVPPCRADPRQELRRQGRDGSGASCANHRPALPPRRLRSMHSAACMYCPLDGSTSSQCACPRLPPSTPPSPATAAATARVGGAPYTVHVLLSGPCVHAVCVRTRTRGQVLAFVDSHCEVNDGWLEPLVARIMEKPTVVVSQPLHTRASRCASEHT